MIIVKLLLMVVFLMPFVFVMGNIASSAEVLSPFVAAPYQGRLDAVVRTGRYLKDATEGFVLEEINFMREIGKGIKLHNIFENIERSHRLKALAETSI